MGQDQAKPAIDRNSSEYKDAQKRFNVVTRAEDVVRESRPEEAEANRLTDMLDGISVMDPLLKSSLQSHILTSKREAAAAELGGSSSSGAANQPASPAAASPSGSDKPSGLQGKGLDEGPVVQLLARSQTLDHRTSTEMLALQDELLSRMANVRYNCQFLKFRASQVAVDFQQFSRLVTEQEQQVTSSLIETEVLSADIVGLMGMIEHMGEELARGSGATDAATYRDANDGS